jgi:hypothetical protein
VLIAPFNTLTASGSLLEHRERQCIAWDSLLVLCSLCKAAQESEKDNEKGIDIKVQQQRDVSIYNPESPNE